MKFFPLLCFSIVILLQVQKASSQVAELNIHSGHSAWIKDFNISSDEKYLATASYDYTVKLWDFKSGKEVRTLKGHTNYVSQVAFSKDGKILASGDISGEVILWDIVNGAIIKKLKRRQYREITSLSISDNNERLISCSRDSSLEVIEIANDKEITWFKLSGQGLKASFMPDNNQVVTLDDYGRIFLWDVKGDSSINGVWYKQGRITDFTISRNGSHLITTVNSDTNNIRTFDIKKWKTLTWYRGHKIYPAAVCNGSDDSTFFTAAYIKKLGSPITYSIEIKKWNLNTGKCMDSLVTPRSIIHAFSLVLTPKSRQLLTMYSSKRLNVYQSSPLTLARAINGGGTLINAVFETEPGNFLLIADDGPIKKMNIDRNEYRIFLPGLEKGAIRRAQISADKKYLFALAYSDSVIYKIDLETNEKKAVASGVDHIREFFINKEQTHIIYRDMFTNSMSNFIDSSELIIKKTNSDSILARKVLRSFMIIPYVLLQDNTSVVYQDLRDTLTIWHSGNNKLTYLVDTSFVNTPITKVLPHGKNSIITVTQTGMLQQWNWETGKLMQSVTAHPGSYIFDYEISGDEKYILTGSDDKLLKLWDAGSFELLRTFKGHESWVSRAGFLSNGRQVFSTAGDYTLRIWDIDSGDEAASLIMVDTADLITRLPNQYYTATRQATKFLSYKIGNELFPFEQFDLKYNRPHEVLRALGTRDTSLVRAYEQAYAKRLKRSGFRETDFNNDLHLPEIVIIKNEDIPQVTSEPVLKLDLKASDDKYFLDRFYVSVNNVPVNGTNGKNLRNLKKKIHEVTQEIHLSDGLNKIQVSCMNDKGVESLRREVYITYNPAMTRASKLYFVGIGVSNFSDKRMDLQYADKDIRDLVEVFKSRYPGMEVDTFINATVTRREVLRVKEKLMKSGVNDIVVISVSSHGLLDEKMDYYIATHDLDFNAPAGKGLKYEDIEDLLSDIPARRKLLMIDACHSGEVDKDELPGPVTGDDSTGVLKENKGTKGIKRKSRIGQQDSFELMKELFADVSRGNGAIVISAASGKEFALENSTWSNGVFTFSLKKALLESLADLNGDGITVNELKNFVSDQVEKYTNGRQRPTTRKENIEFDWKIW